MHLRRRIFVRLSWLVGPFLLLGMVEFPSAASPQAPIGRLGLGQLRAVAFSPTDPNLLAVATSLGAELWNVAA